MIPRLKKKWMSPSAAVPVTPVPVAPSSPFKDFMNLKEAAAHFGVSARSMRGLIAKGFITAKRIGKYDLVRRADLADPSAESGGVSGSPDGNRTRSLCLERATC